MVTERRLYAVVKLHGEDKRIPQEFFSSPRRIHRLIHDYSLGSNKKVEGKYSDKVRAKRACFVSDAIQELVTDWKNQDCPDLNDPWTPEFIDYVTDSASYIVSLSEEPEEKTNSNYQINVDTNDNEIVFVSRMKILRLTRNEALDLIGELTEAVAELNLPDWRPETEYTDRMQDNL